MHSNQAFRVGTEFKGVPDARPVNAAPKRKRQSGVEKVEGQEDHDRGPQKVPGFCQGLGGGVRGMGGVFRGPGSGSKQKKGTDSDEADDRQDGDHDRSEGKVRLFF